MNDKVIICCNVTGDFSPLDLYAPVTVEAIARSAVEAAEQGAAVVKIHARADSSGPSVDPDQVKDIIERIRAQSDALINLDVSGAPGYRFDGRFFNDFNGLVEYAMPGGMDPNFILNYVLGVLEERCAFFGDLKPDLASFKAGTVNTADSVYLNLNMMIQGMVSRMQEHGIKPVFECFGEGMLDNVERSLIDQGSLQGSVCYELGLNEAAGIKATAKGLLQMVELLPPAALWWAYGIEESGYDHISILYAALALGGHIRTGLGDTRLMAKGIEAKSNRELVERAVLAVRDLGKEPATPLEAKAILGLG